MYYKRCNLDRAIYLVYVHQSVATVRHTRQGTTKGGRGLMSRPDASDCAGCVPDVIYVEDGGTARPSSCTDSAFEIPRWLGMNSERGKDDYSRQTYDEVGFQGLQACGEPRFERVLM